MHIAYGIRLIVGQIEYNSYRVNRKSGAMILYEVNNDQEKYKFIIEIEAKCQYTDSIQSNYIQGGV